MISFTFIYGTLNRFPEYFSLVGVKPGLFGQVARS